MLIGGPGNDVVNGGRGDDVRRSLGAGNDTFVWNPGDGSDMVEGQAGFDTLVFNGANINENIDISANGERVRFTATSPTSPWTSTTSSTSISTPSAAPTTSWSTT